MYVCVCVSYNIVPSDHNSFVMIRSSHAHSWFVRTALGKHHFGHVQMSDFAAARFLSMLAPFYSRVASASPFWLHHSGLAEEKLNYSTRTRVAGACGLWWDGFIYSVSEWLTVISAPACYVCLMIRHKKLF